MDLSPERFYTRCVKCNGQGLEHFDSGEMWENLESLRTQICRLCMIMYDYVCDSVDM